MRVSLFVVVRWWASIFLLFCVITFLLNKILVEDVQINEMFTDEYCQPNYVYVDPKRMDIQATIKKERELFEQHTKFMISRGGHFDPRRLYSCTPLQNVAIIIPYRNREADLNISIPYLHNFLMRQKIRYTIYLLEQTKEYLYNKGKLNNVGFIEAKKEDNYDCFIFQDVDTLPANDRNQYGCGAFPRHFCTGVDYNDFEITDNYIGGVVGFSRRAFQIVNGFSTNFWEWGAEDNEMLQRIFLSNIGFTRTFPLEIGYYYTTTGFSHGRSKKDERLHAHNMEVYQNVNKTFRNDGLNNMEYMIREKIWKPFYTHIMVDV